jgi:hypothetical protein
MEQYREHPQPMELYHCGYDTGGQRWIRRGVEEGLSQSMFFKMNEYLKKISTLQGM